MTGRDVAVIRILTLFPEFFRSPLETGLLGRAIAAGILGVQVVNLRDYSDDRFGRCDDYPFGGGSGMVLKPEPLFKALGAIATERTRILLTSPGGRVLNQELVKELARDEDLCIICGHYEGVDQRVIERFVHDEISVGDYVLSGGEYAAMVILDCVARYVPGFMSNEDSLLEESFENGLLEYPQYTRPAEFEGRTVPDILLSGDHGRIRKWRLEQSIEKTRAVRPDLYKRYIEGRKEGEKP
jgi:tRNA (guanine37-N1)-methyltransferase